MSTILETERLLLRLPEEGDIPSMVVLIGDYDVAKNLSAVPHPYSWDDAHTFVGRATQGHSAGADIRFAVLRKAGGIFMGTAGLKPKNGGYELGYWLGKPYWGQGYATEAARRIVRFGFQELNVRTMAAAHFHDNPASGRVLSKLGFRPNGAEPRGCLARGHDVYCRLFTLARVDFAPQEMVQGAI